MKDPCGLCIERDFCQSEFPCRKRQAFLRWKDKARHIREYTKQVMERSRNDNAG